MSAALSSRPFQRRMLRLLLAVFAVATLALIWKVTPLKEYVTPDFIIPKLEAIRSSGLAVPAAIALYVAFTLAFVPHMAMTATVVVVFSPIQAFSICMLGTLISAAIGYAIGRWLSLKSLKAILGEGAQTISNYAKRGGVLGISLLRLLPIAPFTAVNIALAMLEVPFFVFLAGTFLGTLPGAVIASLLGYSALELWDKPSLENFVPLAGGLAAWVALIGFSQYANRRWQKRKARRAAR